MFLETIFPQHVDWIYSLNHTDSKKTQKNKKTNQNPQATVICSFLKEPRSVRKCSLPYCFLFEENMYLEILDGTKKGGKVVEIEIIFFELY